jgi:hypothetical protein
MTTPAASKISRTIIAAFTISMVTGRGELSRHWCSEIWRKRYQLQMMLLLQELLKLRTNVRC